MEKLLSFTTAAAVFGTVYAVFIVTRLACPG